MTAAFEVCDRRGDAALDPVGTVRVHPADDPGHPLARRLVLTHSGQPTLDEQPWSPLTGACASWQMPHGFVEDWPVQPWWHLAAVLSGDPRLLAAAEALYLDGRRCETDLANHPHTDTPDRHAYLADRWATEHCRALFELGRLEVHTTRLGATT